MDSKIPAFASEKSHAGAKKSGAARLGFGMVWQSFQRGGTKLYNGDADLDCRRRNTRPSGMFIPGERAFVARVEMFVPRMQ